MRESGRFKLLDKPVAFPHTEIVNNTPDGPVFDLGVDLEMRDGVVYIKVEHVMEMAEMLGMASKEEVEVLNGTIAKLSDEVEVLPNRIGEFTSELSELVERFHGSLINGNSDNEPSKPLEVTEVTLEKPKRDNGIPPSTDGQEFSFNLLEGLNDLPASTVNERPASKPKPKG